jgi:hypothetical protein
MRFKFVPVVIAVSIDIPIFKYFELPAQPWPVAVEARVHSQASPQGEQSGNEDTLFCEYVLQFLPATDIPPMFHAHSSIYHRRYKISARDSVVKQHS